MRKLFSLLALLASAVAFAQPQNLQWAHSFGNTNNQEMYVDMDVDAAGNSYCVSYSGATSIVGPYTLPPIGSNDAVIVKYDSVGQVLWAIKVGGTGEDNPGGVTIDSVGNVYVIGNFVDPMICGPDTLVSYGGKDIFLIKLDNDGNILWGRHMGSAIAASELGMKVIYSQYDNSLIIAGRLAGPAQFGSLTTTNTSSGSFLAKMDVNGNCIWVDAGNGSGYIFSLAVTAAGEIYSVGSPFSIAKFTPTGGFLWSDAATTITGSCSGRDIAIAPGGSVVCVGNYTQQVSIGNFNLPPPANGDGGFLVKYSSSGTAYAAMDMSGSTFFANAVAVSGTGDIYVAGGYATSFYSDTTLMIDIYQEGLEGFVAKYSPQCQLRWMKQLGTSGGDCFYELDLHNGYIHGSGYIGGQSNGSFGNLNVNSNWCDAFITRFADCSPPVTQVMPGGPIIACEGDVINLSSSAVSTSYTYQWMINGFPLSSADSSIFSVTSLSSASGAYAIQLTSAGCTYTSPYIGVFIYPSSTFSVTVTPYGNNCYNDSVQLSATNLMQHAYQWLLNGTPIPGAVSTNCMAHQSGAYQAVVTNTFGCPDTCAPINVVVGTYPVVTASADTLICQGNSVQLSATGASSYMWTPTAGLTYWATATPTASPSQTTTYYVTGVINSCQDIDTVIVTVAPQPSPLPSVTYNGWILYANYTNNIQWYVDGNLIPSATWYAHVPQQNGDYSFTYTDSSGCEWSSNIQNILNTSIAELSNDAFVQILPNPFADKVHLTFSEIVLEGNITLADISGKIVYNTSLQNSVQVEIPRNSLAAGIYFLSIEADGERKVFKLIAE